MKGRVKSVALWDTVFHALLIYVIMENAVAQLVFYAYQNIWIQYAYYLLQNSVISVSMLFWTQSMIYNLNYVYTMKRKK